MEQKAYRICVYGIVQGVGFRPFVSRIADSLGVVGSVANKGSYVEIYVAGRDEQIEQFRIRLESEAPERSAILKVTCHEISLTDGLIAPYTTFEIIESEKEKGSIFVSPDIATCPKCKAELFDPNNRRYMHPFINCTACGPRLTILDSMPYDRVRTSMGEFPMCPQCEYEYTHSQTRRYDAQPVCCNDCGPEMYLLDTNYATKIGGIEQAVAVGRDAITATRQGIMDGKIIAIKGIGGFHLCCDATNEEVVKRLRELKRRPAKPFAVMMKNLDAVLAQCDFDKADMDADALAELLDGHQKPIVLLPKKEKHSFAPSVAPDNPRIGVMLPYAPVQMLLFEYDDGLIFQTDALVMTSGNVSGAPICRTDEDALSELSGFCDLILSHNRKIRLRADDSVVDLYRGEPYMIRRSRGYAPLPVMSEQGLKGCVLGVGGELKNTFCIAKDELYYESPYVGDMADIRTVHALTESVGRMEELLESDPELVVCDLHPKYNTTVVAEDFDKEVVQVQHHYAHILSCMAENDYDGTVIGLSFDGTGYGTDGTIWGGEVLLADDRDFKRMGSIMPFLQAGGDASAKEGFRIAASMLHDLYGNRGAAIAEALNLCSGMEYALIGKMAEKGINTVKSTSAGRLYDAVSAILGVRRTSSFEGEASVTLQFRAEEFLASCGNMDTAEACVNEAETCLDIAEACVDAVIELHPELIRLKETEGRMILPTDELVKYIVDEICKESMDENTSEISSSNGKVKSDYTNQTKLAYVFHSILARQTVACAKAISELTGINTVALSGGVFQNTLLLRLVEKHMPLKIIRHHLIPPNDGGLALGQAAYGMHKLNRK